MNIFILDKDPVVAARSLHSVHVNKMIVESMQMLSTAHRVLDGTQIETLSRSGRRKRSWSLPYPSTLYEAAYINHPCNLWIRSSRVNYMWLFVHVEALLTEYTFRTGKHHKSENLLPYVSSPPKNLVGRAGTPFVLCMPEQYKLEDAVDSYRWYYNSEKLYPKGKPADWGNRIRPEWINL